MMSGRIGNLRKNFCRRFSQLGRHDFVIYESDISKERTVKRSLVAFHIVKCNKSNELLTEKMFILHHKCTINSFYLGESICYL